MDRFIGITGYEKEYLIKNLKSNMDRFIAEVKPRLTSFIILFKIQYG